MTFEMSTALVALLLCIALAWWSRRPHKPARDGPEGEPYSVFTAEFDWVVTSEDLPDRMKSEHPDIAKGWTDLSGEAWQRAIEVAANMRVSADDQARLAALVKQRMPAQGPVALTFLVDQSGSLKGDPMAAVRSALEAVLAAFDRADVQTEVLGFSTVGWKGGRARQLWRDKGAPKRPGRLCALLHIIYKTGDQPAWSERSQDVMVHPDILRENIDGEAIRWAAGRLRESVAKTKLLVVLSDGAPVDDATLWENGPSYLERDILRAIAEVEAAADICIGAIGLGYGVDRYYPRALKATGQICPMRSSHCC